MFTNIDALYLSQLADTFERDDAATCARLRRIAQNLQSLDERVQVLSNLPTDYAAGYAAAEAAMRRRSNILSNPEGEDAKGESILEQINRRVAEGNLKRIALGERALDDRPHEFNAPRRKAAKSSVPPVDLDLSFLGDL